MHHSPYRQNSMFNKVEVQSSITGFNLAEFIIYLLFLVFRPFLLLLSGLHSSYPTTYSTFPSLPIVRWFIRRHNAHLLRASDALFFVLFSQWLFWFFFCVLHPKWSSFRSYVGRFFAVVVVSFVEMICCCCFSSSQRKCVVTVGWKNFIIKTQWSISGIFCILRIFAASNPICFFIRFRLPFQC